MEEVHDRAYSDRIPRKRFYPMGDRYPLDKLEELLAEEKPRLVFFEVISNPMLMVADCRAIIAAAKKAGAVVMVDNTFTTPYLWNPLRHGADIVVLWKHFYRLEANTGQMAEDFLKQVK